MKKLFFDVETTGLNPEKNDIIELAAIFDDDSGKYHYFEANIKPFNMLEISEDALRVNEISRECLEDFPQPEKVFKSFIQYLDTHVNKYDKEDKLYLIGYNCHTFDSQFLRNFFKKNGSNFFGSYFWHPTIDVMLLASYAAMGQRHNLGNFKLGTVAESLGLKLETGKLHGAMYDTRVTRAIFNLLDEEFKHRGLPDL